MVPSYIQRKFVKAFSSVQPHRSMWHNPSSEVSHFDFSGIYFKVNMLRMSPFILQPVWKRIPMVYPVQTKQLAIIPQEHSFHACFSISNLIQRTFAQTTFFIQFLFRSHRFYNRVITHSDRWPHFSCYRNTTFYHLFRHTRESLNQYVREVI